MKESDRERAIFEAGIKLGALYHQFTGAPLNLKTVESLEKAVEKCISAQPYVRSVRVRIDRNAVRRALNRFGYCELSGEMLDVEVVVGYGGVEVSAGLKVEDGYPLMFIKSIESKSP